MVSSAVSGEVPKAALKKGMSFVPLARGEAEPEKFRAEARKRTIQKGLKKDVLQQIVGRSSREIRRA